jgi:hypothetical protein
MSPRVRTVSLCRWARLLALGGAVLGCAETASEVAPPSGCAPPLTAQVHDMLYLGLRTKGGAPIDEQRFDAFLEAVVTPLFQDGFTVFAASGQWRTSEGRVEREASRVLVLLHASSSRADHQIETLIERYKREFDQESVLWQRSSACVKF